MKEFLKKGTIVNLISTLLFLIIGIVLATKPGTILNFVAYVMEVVLMLYGIITIVNYVRVESRNDVFSCGFVQGVVCILIGLFLIANPTLIVSILPICIGIWMIFGSLTRIQVAMKLSDWGCNASVWYILFSILMFTVGIVFICNPFTTMALIVQMLGIGIILYSILDAIQNIGIILFLEKIDL